MCNIKVLHAGNGLPPYTAFAVPRLPYPEPQVPRFTTAMNELRIVFDLPTQQPRNTTSASTENCDLVLSTATLGDKPTCAWVSPTGTFFPAMLPHDIASTILFESVFCLHC